MVCVSSSGTSCFCCEWLFYSWKTNPKLCDIRFPVLEFMKMLPDPIKIFVEKKNNTNFNWFANLIIYLGWVSLGISDGCMVVILIIFNRRYLYIYLVVFGVLPFRFTFMEKAYNYLKINSWSSTLNWYIIWPAI